MVIISVISLIVISCDTCEISGPENDNANEKIYFTAFSANTEVPNIYSLSKNGTNPKVLVSNGIIYSQPTDIGYICFLRKSSSGNGELYLYNITDSKLQLITKENAVFGISSPVISPDSKKIAFNAGEQKLIVYRNESAPVFNQVSSKLLSSGSAVFSPDSKYVAFIETEDNNSYILKVIDAQNTDVINTILSKSFSTNLSGNLQSDIIHWSNDSRYLCHSLIHNDSSEIIIYDIAGNTERRISLPSNDIVFNEPVISPDNKFVSFINSDGNIWVLSLENNDYKYSKITNFDDGSKSFSTEWSKDMNMIIDRKSVV